MLSWKRTVNGNMGKKGPKGSSARGQEEATIEGEGSGLTGVFAADFPLLCEQSGLPVVAIRAIRRSSCADPEEVDTHHSNAKASYTILVEHQEQDDPSQLKALHIRGWLLSEQVATVLSEALSTSQLSCLSLWNVGLTPNTLHVITQLVQQVNIRHLVLDGNPVTAESLVQLLKARLEHLSLKCCAISDSVLSDISLPLLENKALLSLDLSCNHVGNEGVRHLAAALRMNRTLLSLALASNRIGDEGANLLAEVLSRFALNHEEVVTRRKLLSVQRSSRLEDGQLEVGKEASPKRSPSSTSLDKSGKLSRIEKGGRGKKSDAKKEEKGRKEEKGKKGIGGADAKRGKVKDGKGVKKGGPEVLLDSPRPEPVEAANPLVEVMVEEEEGGRLMMPGNMVLVHLTLAYNCISGAGVSALLQAAKTQQKYPHLGPGLLRVTLHHNLFDGPELHVLTALLHTKDPLVSTEPTSADRTLSDEQ